MDESPGREKTVAEMLSRAIAEIVDNNAHLLTILDVQARLLARLEGRDVEEEEDEIDKLLKARRRAALREIDAWAQGGSTLFSGDAGRA